MTEHSPYFPDLDMCDFWLLYNLKILCGRRFHSKDKTDKAIKDIFLRFQEMDDLRHLIFEIFTYKRVLILERTTLNIPKRW